LRLRPDEGPLPRLRPRLLDRHAAGHGDVRLPRLDREGAGRRRPPERRGGAGATGAVLRRPGGDGRRHPLRHPPRPAGAGGGAGRPPPAAGRDPPRPAALAVQPYDVPTQLWVSSAPPPDWANPEPAGRYNLVVVGAGTAGLISAAGAAGLGARVALVEREFLG